MSRFFKRNKKDDKGFSLVELIIVIAIMAVVVGVAAPQYLRFVERGRNSTDIQNIANIIQATQIYYLDPAKTADQWQVGDGDTFTATAQAGSASSNGLKDALTSAGLTDSTITCKSQSAWTGYTITFTKNSNGNLDATVTLQGSRAADSVPQVKADLGGIARDVVAGTAQ